MPDYVRVLSCDIAVCPIMLEYFPVTIHMPDYVRVLSSDPPYARLCYIISSDPPYARLCYIISSDPPYARLCKLTFQ